jgi:molybdopterin-guanine dinucleotide biosynthesis protein A
MAKRERTGVPAGDSSPPQQKRAGHDKRDIAGAILAGGRSSRMGAEKAFVPLAGRPLIAHALERLGPQVACVYINAREDADRFRALGCPVVVDAPGWRGAGPLAGILAALRAAKAQGFAWLATAPCDAPFLPLDFVARLSARIGEGAPAAVAATSLGLEPMFALWPVGAVERVEAALAAGRASPRSVLAEIGAAETPFAEEESFANLNAPADLAAAEAALARAQMRLRHAITPRPGAARARKLGDPH